MDTGSSITLARELESLAAKVSRSALIPEAYRGKEADVFVAMMMGAELGVSPLQSVQNIDVIDGRPHPRAKLKATLAMRHPACEYFTLVESTPTRATYETKRRGTPTPTRLTYTLEQAQRAGLERKANWQKDPAAMLRARCSGQLADAVYPDATLGLPPEDYAEVEPSVVLPAGSAPQVIDVTPTPAPAPSRTEEIKAMVAARVTPKASPPVQKVVEAVVAPAPASPPAPEAKKRKMPIVDADGANPWWQKCQDLQKLQGRPYTALRTALKELGAVAPASITEDVYKALEAKWAPPEPGSDTGEEDVF